jgi:RNA polymerase sigma-70 factor (ECF subfamily)
MTTPRELSVDDDGSVDHAAREPSKGAPVMTTEDVERSTSRSPARKDGLETADEVGLQKAFLAHGGELLGFARRSLYSSVNAEDAVQETFARAWRSRARFDPSLGSLRTWLFTIERRVIIDIGTHQTKIETVPMDQGEEPAAEDRLETAMLGWQMESALERLDPEHRMIITELYFNGRSGREVAELFAIPEGTVRSRTFYALRMLRLLFEEAGWDQ